jgi:hypothetical protein
MSISYAVTRDDKRYRGRRTRFDKRKNRKAARATEAAIYQTITAVRQSQHPRSAAAEENILDHQVLGTTKKRAPSRAVFRFSTGVALLSHSHELLAPTTPLNFPILFL